MAHLDHLLSIFYAFARSETSKVFPPEKEEDYKRQIGEKEAKLAELEGSLKALRDKLNA